MPAIPFRPLILIVAASLLAGCASAPRAPAVVAATPPPEALAAVGSARSGVANLASASGSLVSGRLVLQAVDGGVRLRGEIGGLVRNGTHNVRLHAHGDCSAVDASSAGDEVDPLRGLAPPVADSGERGRIYADAGGVASVDLLLPGAVLGGSAGNDVAGRALLVLGATPGAISARVACGVIQIDQPE